MSVAVGSSPRVRGKPADPGLRRGSPGLIPACAGKTAPQSPTRCATGAHPRVCGENSRMCLRNISSMGSSPRVRGKQVVEDGHRRRVRLIPACAGKTRPRVLVNRFGGAHPRVCGENTSSHAVPNEVAGSSPRVRGKPRRTWRSCSPRGLIPACAGKTVEARSQASRAWAHPRVCGENETTGPFSQQVTGSSPRVRGKPAPLHGGPRPHRLIPACAGKTCTCHQTRSAPRAHPRVCGENPEDGIRSFAVAGSSPRVRGKPHQALPARKPRRLIPACAGKTRTIVQISWASWAHPRVCGENYEAHEIGLRAGGSSPRVRGKPFGDAGREVRERLIPACAGKTTQTRPSPSPAPAHPRVCGENDPCASRTSVRSGSSPRVRGKPPGRQRRPGGEGLIPACAGKTRPCWVPGAPLRAHPRVCGENKATDAIQGALEGSSPRVRGKLEWRAQRRSSGGLIPACAGKTGRGS